MKSCLTRGGLAVALALLWSVAGVASAQTLTPLEELGQLLYLDDNLSEPAGQACGSCHDLNFATVDPDDGLPVSEGVIPGLFGGRNSPMAAYAMYAPTLYFDDDEGLWIGGQFWDGRATGDVLGDPLADQALGPFLNPVEMANVSKAEVITDIEFGPYADLFEDVWGMGIFNDVEAAYDAVALSIAAFERTEAFAPFDSKYDHFLQICLANGVDKEKCTEGKGKASKLAKRFFTTQEFQGFRLFMDEAECVACHVVDWTEADGNVVVPAWSPDGTVPPLFTDFTFDNLGVPRNLEFPLGPNPPIDVGLGAIVGDPEEDGKFKVMTLRNIGATGPYAHNGLFKTLDEIVHFYNTRDVPAEGWAPAEVPATVNVDELGDLGLDADEEAAVVAFMKTLTDGWTP